ncbi:MAG: permease-like cell division protein FtsX [Desulfotomaculaceae bacterium]|nr:permease-like cell division protein FtsX [Desulfotomaculaceae bacterium]
MRLRTICYYFREALQSILRNSWLSITSIGVVAVSLFILGCSLLVVLNAGNVADNLESSVEISIFFKDQATPAQIKEVEDKLTGLSEVAQYEFVTKQKALEEMKKNFGEQKGILDGLEEEEKNPLPDAFRVKTHMVEQVAPLAKQFEGLIQVDEVRYGQGVVEQLMALSHWVRTAGLVTMVLLGVAAVFLIATTIRLSVFSRRREIEIMKFLGATNWFVRFPFLLEGMFLGLAGSLLAVAAIYYGYFSIISSIQVSLPFVPMVSNRNLIILLMEGLLLAGLVIGAAGSMISVRRFLKV